MRQRIILHVIVVLLFDIHAREQQLLEQTDP